MTIIEQIQTILGVKADGVWGPRSQEALIESSEDQKPQIQRLLGVTADGQWGPVSQIALNQEAHQFAPAKKTTASSFADPADVVAFKRCKTTGRSDLSCFAVGDNGIGQFGKITAQETEPMCAIHNDDMVARWGSQHGAAHRDVEVTANGLTITCKCEDRISERDRIDLNPAAAKLLKLKPPFLVEASWKWA